MYYAPNDPKNPPPCYGHGKDKWLASCDTCTAWHMNQNRLMREERARQKRVAPLLDEARQVALAAAWTAVTAADLRHPDLLDTDLTALLDEVAVGVATEATRLAEATYQAVAAATAAVTAKIAAEAAEVAEVAERAARAQAAAETAAETAAEITVEVTPGFPPNFDVDSLPAALADLLPNSIPGRPADPTARPALRVIDGGIATGKPSVA